MDALSGTIRPIQTELLSLIARGALQPSNLPAMLLLMALPYDGSHVLATEFPASTGSGMQGKHTAP
ncbi:MAG: hypothetical protein RLZZ237_1704 [Pseudomonadota bacterium]|jgi:hypothetical protein